MKKLLCVILAILFLFPLTGCQNDTEDSLADGELPYEQGSSNFGDIPPKLEEEACFISYQNLFCDSSQFASEEQRIISGWIIYNVGDWILLWRENPGEYGEYVWVRHTDTVKRNFPLKRRTDGKFDFYSYEYATFCFKELREPIAPGYPVRVMDGGRLWDY